jgi:hypothetical protein
MSLTSKRQRLPIAAAASLLAVLFAGCQSMNVSQSKPNETSPALLSVDGGKPSEVPAKGRAQIWAETCNRCHNTRSPDSYSGREWAIVMAHMRVRGYLTGEDQRAILEFLQQ